MSFPLPSVNACEDLFRLLRNRSWQNLQLGFRDLGVIKKQTIVNLDTDSDLISGVVYLEKSRGFEFELALLAPRKFEIEITKKSGNLDQDVSFTLAEIVRLRDAALEREKAQGGGSKNQVGLYLQSGTIATDTSKMRFTQAVLSKVLPIDYLMECKDRDFKFVGKNIEDLKNWKAEAKRLGINF